MASSINKQSIGQFEGHGDVGQISRPGYCDYDAADQAYTIAPGVNLRGSQDGFHFVRKRIRGNFILTMRAEFFEDWGNPHRKMGWMARSGLEDNSIFVSSSVHGDGRSVMRFRREAGGPTEEMQANVAKADVIQLERKDNSYITSAARFGDPFEAVRASQIDLGEEIYIGLFVCTDVNEPIEQAIFRDVRIVRPVKEDFERGRDPFSSLLEILNVASGHRQIVYRSEQVIEAPNWTRDGKALIFNRDGRLYRFEMATGTVTLIDTGEVAGNNNDHVLSFDGSRLAISSHGATDGLSRVYTVPVQGGKPKLVTLKGPSYLHGWSPDGKLLVYTGQRNGQYDIYRIPIEGGEEEQLTNTPGLEDGPEYMPDGRYIYFNSVRTGGMQIWRMRPDGSGQEQLTDDKYNNWFPHISPDGKWVVFISYLAGEVAPSDHPAAKRVYLRVMPLDGGTPKVLAYLYGGQGTMNVPSWSPDGSRLAFVSNTVP
ncbi:MAG: biopolymer transporter TolR [Anaerolineales bacterium]|jgi:dipeptidyl aminopeptidase/acylaminoacyl peptidase